MIASLLKKIIGSVSPKTLEVLRAINSRRRCASLERKCGATALAGKIADSAGLEVHDGPFRGMLFPESFRQRAIGSKLLGIYEQELHAVVADAIAQSPERIVIVGSAEGYYAVGLGRAIPSAKITAFDIDPWARARSSELARINGIADRLETRSFCGPRDLLELRGIRSLVVSDCEGFEYRLFTPEVIAALGKSSVIIETHPFVTGDDNAALLRAFAPTHSVHTIPFVPNSRTLPKKFSTLLSDEEFAMAADEGRCAESEWLWAKPRPEER